MPPLLGRCVGRSISWRISRADRLVRASARAASGGTFEAQAEAATWAWVDSCVIGMGLCPFAAPVRLKSGPALRCAVSNSTSVPQLLRDVRAELAILAPGITSESPLQVPESTLLVIAPGKNRSFLVEYREFVHVSWEVQQAIVDAGLQSALQVVLFHPRAVHSTYQQQVPNDCGGYDSEAVNYSIRSPYPTLHFLRERDIMAAVTSGCKADLIPSRNAAKLTALGTAHLRSKWRSLFEAAGNVDGIVDMADRPGPKADH